MDSLHLFFTRIKELSFWQRIFFWSSLRTLSYEAYIQFTQLEQEIKDLKVQGDIQKNKIAQLEIIQLEQNKRIQDFEKLLSDKDNEMRHKESYAEERRAEIANLNKQITTFKSTQEEKGKKYEHNVEELNQLKKSLEKEHLRLNDNRVKEKQEAFESMKKQWREHEDVVRKKMKQLCQEYIIPYIDKVPFKGSPDNTIKICNEFIIFDAKSPANDDLTNFPKYIKTQTEHVKKYTNQESVKKEIYLVVPSNTIENISPLVYPMGDYDVYIITLDALEPIILSLKKIETYEFVEQLSPEERDNVCRIIGKFAHATKRKIQIDQFFTNQFIELLVKCKNDLPKDIMQSVVAFEKAEKLNPPTEKRAKQILTKELKENHDSINGEAQIRNIIVPKTFDDIKKLE